MHIQKSQQSRDAKGIASDTLCFFMQKSWHPISRKVQLLFARENAHPRREREMNYWMSRADFHRL
jgi:hypothetical protein